jgi:hypothetical protein
MGYGSNNYYNNDYGYGYGNSRHYGSRYGSRYVSSLLGRSVVPTREVSNGASLVATVYFSFRYALTSNRMLANQRSGDYWSYSQSPTVGKGGYGPSDAYRYY